MTNEEREKINTSIAKLCKHCSSEDGNFLTLRGLDRTEAECYEHCHKAEDGKHEADPNSASIPAGSEFLVDYTCKHCGSSGSLAVNPDDIMWE